MPIFKTRKGLVASVALASAVIFVFGHDTKAESAGASSSVKSVCDRFASVRGDDGHSGARAHPFGSVEHLVDRLRPGQAGCLLGGTFDEHVGINHGGVPGRPITLRSAPGQRATIVGTFEIGPNANDVVIAGLRLNGRGRASPQVNGDRVTFRGNDITDDHTGICLTLGGAFESGYGRAEKTVVDHNRIHDCGRMPPTRHDHGIYVEGADGARITNNVIYDNADYAIHLYPDAQHTYIASNIMDGNGGGILFAGEKAGGEYRRDYASSYNVVRNNVISNSRNSHNIESWWGGPVGTGNIANRNCLWRGADGNISDQVGFRATKNVIVRPLYRNRGIGDFRLKPRSTCARILRGR